MSSSELAEANVTRLEARVAQLESALNQKEEKERDLTHTLTVLDREHDTMRDERDQQDEKLCQMEKDLTDKVQDHGN